MVGMKTMVEKWFSRLGARADGVIEGEVVRDGRPGVGESPAKAAGPDAGRAARGGDPIVIPVAEFGLGDVVRHRFFPFRGVVFDVDPQFANTDEWWEAIPEAVRPRKDQPFYHLLAENEDSAYVAYVSQQNLLPDDSGLPVLHPAVVEMFDQRDDGSYVLKRSQAN